MENQIENNQPVATPPAMDKQKLILPASILIAAVLVSGALLFSKKDSGGVPNTPPEVVEVSADNDPMLGDKDAKVMIIEFSDFQCPFCRKFWREALASIRKEYVDTGKAKLVYRDFPLSGHPAAHISAQASECAHEQGKYWEMHDKMFSEQDKQGEGTVTYGENELKKWAKEIGLNTNQFNQCLSSGKYKAEVDKDFQDGNAAGVTGTPTVYVNGKKIVGAQEFSVFKQAIEAELTKKKSFFK